MAGSGRKHAKGSPPATGRRGGGRSAVPGALLLGVSFLAVSAAAAPAVLGRAANDVSASTGFLAPLALWTLFALVAFRVSRPAVFSGSRGLVSLTVLLSGLGVAAQLRLGTWAESWTAWRAFLPLAAGMAGFLVCVRWLPAGWLAAWLPRLAPLAWLAGVGTLAALRLFGHVYRGGMFLPGQVSPSESAKLFLVLALAGWLPARMEAFGRTRLGVPAPPWGLAACLALAWGVPLALAVAVRDLGLALILCLTLAVWLAAATRRWGWLGVGAALGALAGWGVPLLSRHAQARVAVWLDPFRDPLGAGWQLGQSLSALYAGGLWGAGIGEGAPRAVPIVSSDFVYAALAEEWGLAGCALLLALYWAWLGRLAASGAEGREPCRLLGLGAAALLGVQIALNVGGVTKALPMTGITLPLLSQGGFSMMATLLLCGLCAAASKREA